MEDVIFFKEFTSSLIIEKPCLLSLFLLTALLETFLEQVNINFGSLKMVFLYKLREIKLELNKKDLLFENNL
jgi:hypothetical protein